MNYYTPGRATITQMLASLGSDWDSAFRAFAKFFKAKTKIDWDRRTMEKGKLEEGAFMYMPPKNGGPVGLLPADYGL